MKKWGILLLYIIFCLLLNSAAVLSKAADKTFDGREITLNSFCEECKKNVNVEEEIKKHFGLEPIFISLDECIDIAMMNNFNIKAVHSTYKSAKYDYKNSLAEIFLPEAGFQSYVIHYDGQVLVGAALAQYFNELAISATFVARHDLTEGGKKIFQAMAEKNIKKARYHNLDFTKDEVLLNTSRYYYELLLSKLSLEIYLKNYAERTAQLKLTENLAESGLGTKFDVIRSKSEQAQARQNLLNALNDFRISQARLANVMGIEINSTLVPVEVEANPYELVDESKTIDDLFEIAIACRDDLKSVRDEIKAMKDEKLVIYSEFIPRPRIFVQQQWQGTAKIGVYPNTVLGAYIDIDVGKRLGVSTILRARGQQARIDARKYELIQKMRDIKEAILNSYYNCKIAKERMDIAQKQVDYASESVRLAELRLDAGEGLLIDVIQAQTLKTEARIELLKNIIEYDVNQIQLLFDNGTISPDAVLKNYNP